MTEIKILANPEAAAESFARDFAEFVQDHLSDQPKITVALSGGSTPKRLFRILADQFADRIDWHRVHFFWGDERCVPPDDPESNFGAAKELLLDQIEIPPTNIHRILGESDPEVERNRYEQELETHLAKGPDGIPQFDLIILGMGDDGHTASIFPHQLRFMESARICEVATHPVSGQQRITLTGQVLNHGSWVCFLITGKNKAGVLAEVIRRSAAAATYPARANNRGTLGLLSGSRRCR